MKRRSLLLSIVLAAAVLTAPGYANNASSDTAFGYLFSDASCPAAAFALTSCHCDPPLPVTYDVISTKIDLRAYAGNYVSLKGSIEAGGCGVPIFKVKQATVFPPISCPCPASGPEPGPAPICRG